MVAQRVAGSQHAQVNTFGDIRGDDGIADQVAAVFIPSCRCPVGGDKLQLVLPTSVLSTTPSL